VGENDSPVIDLNRKAWEKLPGAKNLKIIENASPVFEEPGTLEQVAELSGDWFINYLNKELIPTEVENSIQESKSFFSVHNLSRNFVWEW
jgi:hypothetical protein